MSSPKIQTQTTPAFIALAPIKQSNQKLSPQEKLAKLNERTFEKLKQADPKAWEGIKLELNRSGQKLPTFIEVPRNGQIAVFVRAENSFQNGVNITQLRHEAAEELGYDLQELQSKLPEQGTTIKSAIAAIRKIPTQVPAAPKTLIGKLVAWLSGSKSEQTNNKIKEAGLRQEAYSNCRLRVESMLVDWGVPSRQPHGTPEGAWENALPNNIERCMNKFEADLQRDLQSLPQNEREQVASQMRGIMCRAIIDGLGSSVPAGTLTKLSNNLHYKENNKREFDHTKGINLFINVLRGHEPEVNYGAQLKEAFKERAESMVSAAKAKSKDSFAYEDALARNIMDGYREIMKEIDGASTGNLWMQQNRSLLQEQLKMTCLRALESDFHYCDISQEKYKFATTAQNLKIGQMRGVSIFQAKMHEIMYENEELRNDANLKHLAEDVSENDYLDDGTRRAIVITQSTLKKAINNDKALQEKISQNQQGEAIGSLLDSVNRKYESPNFVDNRYLASLLERES